MSAVFNQLEGLAMILDAYEQLQRGNYSEAEFLNVVHDVHSINRKKAALPETTKREPSPTDLFNGN
jgi:hypothetical protein